MNKYGWQGAQEVGEGRNSDDRGTSHPRGSLLEEADVHAAERYEQVSKAIMAVLPAKPIKFTVLAWAKRVGKQLPNFEGLVAWYTVSVARELEAQGKLIRHTKPVLYSKPRKQRSNATSDTPAKNNATTALRGAKGAPNTRS